MLWSINKLYEFIFVITLLLEKGIWLLCSLQKSLALKAKDTLLKQNYLPWSLSWVTDKQIDINFPFLDSKRLN